MNEWHIPAGPLLEPPTSALVVRTIHLLAVALLVGGAVTAWWLVRRDGRRARPPPNGEADAGTAGHGQLVPVAVSYEWLFWGAAGLVVLTGVGNLGAMAPGVPDPSTAGGRTLAVKVAAVLLLLVASVPRTVAVATVVERRSEGDRESHDGAVTDRLAVTYASTAIYLVGLLVLGVMLAHG